MMFLIKVLLLTKCMAVIANNATRPNIMIIFADDVGTGDVPGYWDDSGLVDMPNFEQFLANGTTFLDAHSTPLCAPSRYVLLSGNYQHKGREFRGSWTLDYKGSQFRKGQKSIAHVLRDKGYNTGMFGKWHLGGKIPTVETFAYDPQAAYYEQLTRYAMSSKDHDWTQPLIQGPWDIGFSESYVTVGGIQRPPFAFLRNSTFQQEDLDNLKYWKEGTYSMPFGKSQIPSEGEGSPDWDSTAYNMILVNETEKFLERHVQNNTSNQPFFTYVSLGGVHIPHTPPDKYIDESKVSGQYPTNHMDLLGEMDKVLGSLIQILDDKDLLEDTIIVFTSDNGGIGRKSGSKPFGHFSSGPLRGHKGSIYEGGHRVPMTIRWDNGMIPKGQTRDRVVGINDLFATLMDLVQYKVPKDQATDSISFADYIMDENNTQGMRESLGVWQYKGDPGYFYLDATSVRKGELKLVYFHRSGTAQLFNLTDDISELDDVAHKNEEKVKELLEEMKLFGPCVDKKGLFHIRRDKPQIKNSKIFRYKSRDCKWFEKKRKRCYNHHEGRMHCGLTCALERESFCSTLSNSTTNAR